MSSQPGTPDAIPLLPLPESVEYGGRWRLLAGPALRGEFSGVRTERLDKAITRLGAMARDRASARAPGSDPTEVTSVYVNCASASPRYPGIEEDESYWLVHDDAGIYLDAPTEWGVLRGLETLGQLIGADGRLPYVAVDDRPRFPWRGLMLDPARRFLNLATVLRTLDGMALCKLNVLHLHLSDDQGFRFPSRAYPELASDECYTIAELAMLIEHAADLGIRVVPELDMPGHVTSWLVAHPEWGSRPATASRKFGVHEACLDPTSEAVYQAVARLLGEVMELFPDPCVHIGGDEVHPAWWSQDQSVAALMASEGITDLQSVQARFNTRVGRFVTEQGRRVVAWDEVLHPDLAADWIVQAWRGATARDKAIKHGNRVVLSAPYYLDLHFPAATHYGFDPTAGQAELLAQEDALLTDPRFAHVADGMRWTHGWRNNAVHAVGPADAATLGGEACLWGELVDAQVLDVRLWSRLPAVAERLWSASHFQNARDLEARLDWYLSEIHPCRGVDVRARSREQLAALGIGERWLVLTDLLEPVKWYGRLLGEEALAGRVRGEEMPQARPYDADTRLNRLVDFLPPESFRARELSSLCSALLAGDSEAGARLRAELNRWRELLANPADAPADLAEILNRFVRRLGLLADAVETRLAAGPIAAGQLAAIIEPHGELMIAVGPEFRSWLTGS